MPSAFEFRPTAFLAVRGLTNHFRAPGLGAPVVAVRRGMPRLPGAAGNVFPTYERFYPLTALVVFEEHAESVEAMLRLTDPLAGSGIELAERRVPVAADYSASLAVAVGDTDIGGIGEGGMFWPGSHLQQTGLYLLEPFRQDKIPVVFIHGLGATPWTWLEMVNDLRGDREIRRNYQFWFFNYPTGLSFAVSAMLCRRALDQAQELYDPDGGIPSMGRIVLIGHSMGGLISRLLVTDDTSGIWNAYFTRPIEQLLLDPSDADLVREAFLGGAVPYVDRVVFLATPHRGSPFADNVIGRTGAAIARLPDDLREMTQRILDANADALAPEVSTSRRGEKGIESTSPESPLIRGLSGTVVAPGITYHSILGDRGKGDGDRSSDGIVPYWSAHLEGAATEITVPSNHIVQDDPAAIEEVRRILLLHLAPATPVGR